MTPQPPEDPALRAALDEIAEMIAEDVLHEEREKEDDQEAA